MSDIRAPGSQSMRRRQGWSSGLQIAMRRIPMMRKPGYDRTCGARQGRFELKDTPRSARNPLIGFAHETNKQRTARMRLLGSGVSNGAGKSASDGSARDTITAA
jgi:hypothetical protein